MMIEGLLIMCLTVAILAALSKKLKDSNLIPGLISKPWAKVAGMVETGTWNVPDDASRKVHPNTYGRFYTPSEH